MREKTSRKYRAHNRDAMAGRNLPIASKREYIFFAWDFPFRILPQEFLQIVANRE